MNHKLKSFEPSHTSAMPVKETVETLSSATQELLAKFETVESAQICISDQLSKLNSFLKTATNPRQKTFFQDAIDRLTSLLDSLSNPTTSSNQLSLIKQYITQGKNLSQTTQEENTQDLINSYFPINSSVSGLATEGSFQTPTGNGSDSFELPRLEQSYLTGILEILNHFGNNTVYTRGQQNEETMRKHSYTFITLKDYHITIAESFVYGNVLFVIDSQTEFNTPTSHKKIKTYHEDLLQLTKNELELVPNAIRFEHTQNWKQEVIEYIEQLLQNRENEGVEQEKNFVLDSEIDTIDSGTFTPISVVEERIERWEEIIDTIISGKKLSSATSKDPEEAKLGKIISNYKSSGKKFGMTDEQESWLNDHDIRPLTIKDKQANKEQRVKNWDTIIEFITTHNRHPAATSKDRKEAKWGSIITQYKSNGKKSGMTDEQESWLNDHDIRPITDEEKDLKKEQRKKNWDAIIEFITTHNRHPSTISKDRKEAKLGSIITHYKSKGQKSGMTDEQESWLNDHDIRPITDEEKDLKKEHMKKNWDAIIEFITTHNRHPSTTSKDPKEGKLGSIITHYKSSGKKFGMTDEQESWLNKAGVLPKRKIEKKTTRS